MVGKQHSRPCCEVFPVFWRAWARGHGGIERLRGCGKGLCSACPLPKVPLRLTRATRSASYTIVLMFLTLRSFTPSSSSHGLNIKQGAWLAPPSTVRSVCPPWPPIVELASIVLTMEGG